jgi:type III secretion system low calcium response chaperone LcrH/SycD
MRSIMKPDELGDYTLSEKVKKKLKNKSKLLKDLASGKTAQEILEFTEATMAKFYRAAHYLFEHQKYTDAGNAFLFLVTLNPHNHDYWLGLGMSTQKTGDYEGAIDAYEMAAYYDINNPVPYFYLAKCFFAVHEHENSLHALDLAIEYAEESDQYEDLKRQAIKAKKLLIENGLVS